MDKEKLLNEELLDKVSGGSGQGLKHEICPHCGEVDNTHEFISYSVNSYTCNICGCIWHVHQDTGEVRIISEPAQFESPEAAKEYLMQFQNIIKKKFGK